MRLVNRDAVTAPHHHHPTLAQQVQPRQTTQSALDALALCASCAPASVAVQRALAAPEVLDVIVPVAFPGLSTGAPCPQPTPLSTTLGACRLLSLLYGTAPAAVDEVG